MDILSRLHTTVCSKKARRIRIARRLGVSAEEFKRKLREHEKFNEYQISCLVELMKAKAAFRVLYFPTLRMRRRIYKEVFG